MRIDSFATPELLGVYGMSTNEQIAEYLFNVTSDKSLQAPTWAKVTSLGLSKWNGNLVKVISDNYSLLKQRGTLNPSALALQSGTTVPIAEAFMDMKASPKTTQPKGLLDSAKAPIQETVNLTKLGLYATIAVAGVILLNNIKGLVPNVKKET